MRDKDEWPGQVLARPKPTIPINAVNVSERLIDCSIVNYSPLFYGLVTELYAHHIGIIQGGALYVCLLFWNSHLLMLGQIATIKMSTGHQILMSCILCWLAIIKHINHFLYISFLSMIIHVYVLALSWIF
jgi:protein-S-isoprenylcysteine O-methyltransferase Ste14